MFLHGIFYLPSLVFNLVYLIFFLRFCETYFSCFDDYLFFIARLPINSQLVAMYFMDWSSIRLFRFIFYSRTFLALFWELFLNVFFWLLFFSFCLNFHKLISFGLCFKNPPRSSTCILRVTKNQQLPKSSFFYLVLWSVQTQWVWRSEDNFWELGLFHLTWDLMTKFRCWTFMANAFTWRHCTDLF